MDNLPRAFLDKTSSPTGIPLFPLVVWFPSFGIVVTYFQDDIRYGARVTGLNIPQNRVDKIRITCSGLTKEILADYVICTVPLAEMAFWEFSGKQFSPDKLRAIRYPLVSWCSCSWLTLFLQKATALCSQHENTPAVQRTLVGKWTFRRRRRERGHRPAMWAIR